MMTTRAKGIPEGCHTITPYLIVHAPEEAIEFYKRAFGAEEVLRMPGPDGKGIMHAELRIGDSLLFLTGEWPDWGCLSPRSLKGTPVSLHLYVENVDAAFKRAVDAGATVKVPVADMFWGDRHGKLVDPYGHEWGIATQKEALTPEQVRKNTQAYFAEMARPRKP